MPRSCWRPRPPTGPADDSPDLCLPAQATAIWHDEAVMKMLTRSRRPTEPLPGVTGTARVGRDPLLLAPRLRPGDVAVIDRTDLDRASAHQLIAAGVSGVVNAGAIVSGRYPAPGGQLLSAAGIVVIDQAERSAAIKDGATIRLCEGEVWCGDEVVAQGREVDSRTVELLMEQAQQGLADHVESFTRTSAEFLRREHGLLLDGADPPRLATRVRDRPVVLAAAATRPTDIAPLRRYLAEQHPVVVAVDQAAQTLTDARIHVDVVVLTGDAGQLPVSAAVLHGARDVVVCADGDDVEDTPITRELAGLGVSAERIDGPAATADMALLLIDAHDPTHILGVGLHPSLIDIVDRHRRGAAAGYLIRLKVGPRLVDAQTAAGLYGAGPSTWQPVLVLLAGLVAVAVALAVTPDGQVWWSALLDWVRDRVEGSRW